MGDTLGGSFTLAAGGSAHSSMTPGTFVKARVVANHADTDDDTDEVSVAIALDSSDAEGAQTDDDGDDDASTNSLVLRSSTPFVDAVYSGTIYFEIAQGS